MMEGHIHVNFPIGKETVADILIEVEMTSDERGPKVDNHTTEVYHDNSEHEAHDSPASIWVVLV